MNNLLISEEMMLKRDPNCWNSILGECTPGVDGFGWVRVCWSLDFVRYYFKEPPFRLMCKGCLLQVKSFFSEVAVCVETESWNYWYLYSNRLTSYIFGSVLGSHQQCPHLSLEVLMYCAVSGLCGQLWMSGLSRRWWASLGNPVTPTTSDTLAFYFFLV